MKALRLVALLSLALTLHAQTTPSGLREIRIDASKEIGRIRSFQGVNGIPTPMMDGLPNLQKQFAELHIDTVRTHDSMGPTDIAAQYSLDNRALAWLVPDTEQRRKLVEAGNAAAIFPDWSADPDKPESYNFAPTDRVIQGIRATGAEVFFRVGRSFGADFTPIPAPEKFAAVVKHVAMHYNQGWANGFQNSIHYWEFWNEEDLPLFWIDPPEKFYQLYAATARALKQVDPTLKVGGGGLAMGYYNGPYREGLFDYCAAHKLPLDFFSWHHYAMTSADPYDFTRIAQEVREVLDARGFTQTQSILSEWNLTPDFTAPSLKRLQGIENAAFVGDVLIYMQDSRIDMAHFYRADAAWMGLFGLGGEYFKPAYTYLAMGKMLSTPRRLALSGADNIGLAALAGRSEDGSTIQFVVSNYEVPANFKAPDMPWPDGAVPKGAPRPDLSHSKPPVPRTEIVYKQNRGVHLLVEHLPWGKAEYRIQRYRLTDKEDFILVGESTAKGEHLELTEPLAPPALELIVLRRK